MGLNQYDIKTNYLIRGKGRVAIYGELYSLKKQFDVTPKNLGEGWTKHKSYKWVELEAKIDICQKLLRL